MREIKFRAWDKVENKMLYGDDVSIIYNEICFDDFSEEDCEDLKGMKLWVKETPISASIHDAVFMQYTGLKDKNGKEIYEGDIIKVYDDYETLYGIGNVTFCCGCWYVGGNIHEPLWDLKRDYYFEIIGNIFENKELLNG